MMRIRRKNIDQTTAGGALSDSDRFLVAQGDSPVAKWGLLSTLGVYVRGFLGTLAVQNANNIAITGGSMTGVAIHNVPTPTLSGDAAPKSYVDGIVAAQDAMVFKGVIDCSANPNYPAADRGWTYRASVAGKIGGASGIPVEIGDVAICLTDGTVTGTQAAVGANWGVLQANLDGAVIGPASASDATPAVFDGGTGKLLKNITFAAFKTALVLVKGDVGLGNVDNTSDAAKPVSAAQAAALRGAIAGLTLSAAGASASFGIAVGAAANSTAAVVMVLATAYTKTNGAWTVGTGNGALDTGSIANGTWYHVYLIRRTDTGVVDVLVSTSATAPTLPTSYTQFRRIGSMLTDGSAQWVKFIQDGDRFTWDVPVIDYNGTANPGTSAVLRALSIPAGVNVLATYHARSVTTVIAAVGTLFSDPAIADTAATLTNAQQIGNTTLSPYAQIQTRADTSRQVRVRLSASDANVLFYLVTEGWIDTRGQFA